MCALEKLIIHKMDLETPSTLHPNENLLPYAEN